MRVPSFSSVTSVVAWLDDAAGHARAADPRCHSVGLDLPFPLWAEADKIAALLPAYSVRVTRSTDAVTVRVTWR